MFKYRIMALVIIFAAIAIILAASTYCQDDNIKTVDGRVVSVDPQNSQIVVKVLDNMTFSVPSGAKVTNSDGFDIQLKTINTGNYVMVDYYDNASGAHIARNINVEYNR